VRGNGKLYDSAVRQPLDPQSPSVLVALRLPASLLRRVDQEAKRRGIGRSAAIRAMVEEAMQPRRKAR
jgi:metal-responsive CopG/Arc/MetJ family transcriptional regulator